MTKKLSALFIALIMLFSFSFISRGASADISGNVVHGNIGDTVTVVIRMNSNPGFACLRLFFEYDNTALELKDACDEGLLGVNSTVKNIGDGKCSISWGEKGERNIYYDKTGDIASLVFKITDKAKSKKYDVKLSYDRDFADDRDANPVTMNLTNGTIIISEGSAVSQTDTHATTVPITTQNNNQSTTKNNVQNTTKSNQVNDPSNDQGAVTSSAYSGQGNDQNFIVDQNGETIPKATHYPNTPVTDEDGSVISYPLYESITDEKGSIIYETAAPEQSETGIPSKDSANPHVRSNSAVKIVVIIAALALAFVLIFLFVRKKTR